MAAAIDPLSSEPPLAAAPNLDIYTQFSACDVPPGSEAKRAYRGFIRPFSDDATALRVIRALEKGLPVQVDAGRLDHCDSTEIPGMPYEKFLTQMATPFTVLALEFSGSQRPRTYLINPPMLPRLSACEHLRGDKCIELNGSIFPALCVYSGNLLKFTSDCSEVEQVLDQTATYLAKYLVWLKTRKLYRRTERGPKLVRDRRSGEPVTAGAIEQANDLFWSGHWPGHSAPSDPAGHLASIGPKDECWCWSGRDYFNCCRPRDLERLRELEIALFTNKLILAVRSKSEKTMFHSGYRVP